MLHFTKPYLRTFLERAMERGGGNELAASYVLVPKAQQLVTDMCRRR